MLPFQSVQCLPVLVALCLAPVGASQPVSLNAKSVYDQLTVQRFAGSGTESVSAVATDRDGNIYVAGTTTSPDFPATDPAGTHIGVTLLRSDDLGATWKPLAQPSADLKLLSIWPSASVANTLFAITANGIAKTVDGGGSWKLLANSPSSAQSIATFAANPSRLLVMNSSGSLIGSNDAGESWTNVAQPGNPQSPLPTVMIAEGFDTVAFLGFREGNASWDEGRTWSHIVPPGNSFIRTAALDPHNRGWIYLSTGAGTQGSLYLSTDFGEHWTQKAVPPSAFNGMTRLVVDPEQPNRLYAIADVNDVWVSDDAAASWSGGKQYVISSLALLPRNCSGGVLLGVGKGSHPVRSLDFGLSWESAEAVVDSVSAGAACTLYAARTVHGQAFVTKLAPGGRQVLWSTEFGGQSTSITAIAADMAGNISLTGQAAEADFPPDTPSLPCGSDSNRCTGGFVIRYDSSGFILYTVTFNFAANALAVDPEGSTYLVGYPSNEIPVTPGALQTAPATPDSPGFRGSFIVKLHPDGRLAYASYLPLALPVSSIAVDGAGQASVVGDAVPQTGYVSVGGFLIRLNAAGSAITHSATLPGTRNVLATDADGNVFAAGMTDIPDFPLTPGGWASGIRSQPCYGIQGFSFTNRYFPPGDAYVIKLRADDLAIQAAALLGSACRSEPTTLSLGATGRVAIGLIGGLGFPLHNPVAAAPLALPTALIGAQGSAAAVLDAKLSTLLWSSYIDSNPFTPVTLSGEGSLFAASNSLGHIALLLLSTDLDPAVSIQAVSNAFSGFTEAIAPGELVTITGTNLAVEPIDLGLSTTQPLPKQLGGTQVFFDGVAAPILQVGPERIICVAPPGIVNQTAVLVVTGGNSSNPVIVPVVSSAPGLLTRDFPNTAPYFRVTDAVAQNPDGTVNDADHPARRGSIVTLYGTGFGLTQPALEPGSFSTTNDIHPINPVYPWGDLQDRAAYNTINPPTPPVSTVAGMLSSVFEIKVPVPTMAQPSGDVERLTVAILPAVPGAASTVEGHPPYNISRPANLVGVYVR